MEVQAMLFAAGLGTRLYPLTDKLPKALAPFWGSTLLDYNIQFLANQGIKHFVINTYHFADKIREHLAKKAYSNLNIQISQEDNLMDTAGGIAYASSLFSEDFDNILLYNVDVISSIDILRMEQELKRQACDILLATRERTSSRYLLFNDRENLKGWENKKTNEIIVSGKSNPENLQRRAFSGIQLIKFEVLHEFEKDRVFSLIDFYLEKMDHLQINSYPHDEDHWFDCGSVDKLKRAEDFLTSSNQSE